MQTPPAPPDHQPPSPPYAAPPSRPYNPWAIVSISLAASTVIGSWCLGGVIAVITGHVARHQIKASGEAGANLALAGLIVGYVAIGLFLLFIAAYVAFFVFFVTFAATHASLSPSPSSVP
jgi:hypothetical protein